MALKNHITAIILDYSLKDQKKYKLYSPGTPWYFSIDHSPHIVIGLFWLLMNGNQRAIISPRGSRRVKLQHHAESNLSEVWDNEAAI